MTDESSEESFDLDFENVFGVMTSAMRINRSHPDIKRDIKWIFQFGIMHGVFSLMFGGLVYSIIFHDLKNNDYTQACANGILCVIFNVVTFSYVLMLYHQNIFKNMIAKMNRDYELAKHFPKDEQNIIKNFAGKGQRVIKLWLVVGILSAGLFPIKAIVLMIYYTTVSEFKYVHLFDLTYPDSVEEVKNTLGVFIVLYIYFLYCDLYSTTIYISFVPLGPVFMLHACGQVELTKTRVMKVFNDNSTAEEKNKRLSDIAKLLDDIYSFVHNIKISLKILYELTLKGTVVIIPISLYQVIESYNNGEFRIEFITVALGAMALSSIPCYFSDVLMSTGEELRLAVYSCSWEKHWNKKNRSFVILLLQRTSQPIALRTMFRDLCLDSLTDVYRQSYAIFNLLNAVCK